MKPARELYPDFKEPFYGPSDYDPIIHELGEVILSLREMDYQGDTFTLLKKGESYGISIIGWGSCSGCDALQSCGKFDQIDKLAKEIESEVKWFDSKEACLAYIYNHDWQGDYLTDAKKEFIEKARMMLA